MKTQWHPQPGGLLSLVTNGGGNQGEQRRTSAQGGQTCLVEKPGNHFHLLRPQAEFGSSTPGCVVLRALTGYFWPAP